MSQFSVYCCESDTDFTAPGLWHLRQKKETKERRVCRVSSLVTHHLLTMCARAVLTLSPKNFRAPFPDDQ